MCIRDSLMQLQIEQWPVDRLIPYIRNARTHSDAQVAQVAGSIAEFGFVNPILVGPDGVLVAGHARLAAARMLKLTEVPVIVLAHLSETQRRALVLADNKLAENAGWDEEMLRVELETLQADGFSLELVGFSDEELEALLRDPEQVAAGLTDEDAAPDVPETAVTVLGDIWLLGPHRLLCGDATQMADVEKVMAGGLADLSLIHISASLHPIRRFPPACCRRGRVRGAASRRGVPGQSLAPPSASARARPPSERGRRR